MADNIVETLEAQLDKIGSEDIAMPVRQDQFDRQVRCPALEGVSQVARHGQRQFLIDDDLLLLLLLVNAVLLPEPEVNDFQPNSGREGCRRHW